MTDNEDSMFWGQLCSVCEKLFRELCKANISIKMNANRILIILGVSLLLLAVFLNAKPASREFNLVNLPDYYAENTLQKFTKQTGIKVNLTTVETENEVERILDAGDADFDLAIVTLHYITKKLQMKKNVFIPLDKTKLPNLQYLNSANTCEAAEKDPFNAFSVPYVWGTIGLGYNKIKANIIFGDKPPVNSWAMLFEVENLKKLKHCGVAFINSPEEVLPLIINYLGGNPNTTDKEHYRAAKERLEELAPYVSFSSDLVPSFSNGDYCAALGWSGDVQLASELTEETDRNSVIEYSIPREGTATWHDMFVILPNASHVEEAHEFINFMMQPEIIAEVSNYLWYPNCSNAAKEFMEEEIINNPSIYPPLELQKNLYLMKVASKELEKLRSEIWQQVVEPTTPIDREN